MRRFASLFKRNDNSASTTISSTDALPRSTRTTEPPPVKKQARFFRSLSLKSVKAAVIREPLPPVPHPPLQASSFSTSSTDSPAPATPDDDSEFAPSVSHRNSNQWPERRLTLPHPVAAGSFDWDPHRNSSPSLPPIQTVAKPPYSEDPDDASSTASSPHSLSSSFPVSPLKPLHSSTAYALSPTFSAPPLLYLPNVPLFPRSANSVSSLPHQETTASTLFRTHILRRLERRDLTVSEERSIAPFTPSRALPAKPQFLLSKLDDGPICDLKRVSNVSQGLKHWISRPCFEDRMSVYTPGPSGRPDDIAVHTVSGGPFGVAALEVSETLEFLAGYNVEGRSEMPWLPASSVSSMTDLQFSTSAPTVKSASIPQTVNQPRKADPSPLRTESTPSPDQTKPLKPEQPPLQPSLPSKNPSSTSLTNVTTRKKRARSSVRFDVDEKQDKDEHVPLGHIIRIKRGREERAKFLELEKGRRALEEERQKHETEKRKWEQERRAWEAERKLVEEEKKKRLYQQEVIAARKRRESQAFRVGPPSTDSPEIEPQNSRQASYSRPVYDTLRQESLDGSSLAASHPLPRDDSFNSLRGTSKPQSFHSMPPSRNSSSTASSNEDATKTTGRPTSMLSASTPQLPMMIQPYGYPWGMPVMPQMPMHMQMIPQMPYYYPTDNMPLLPPAAPFMMQQTGNRRNSRSSSSSPNRSSTSLGNSASQSTDRLPPNQGTSSTRRPTGHQRSSSGGTSNQLGPGQQSNQGSVSSRRSSGIANDPNQLRNSTRSRPPMPQSHSQRPGSWVFPSPAPQMRQNTIS